MWADKHELAIQSSAVDQAINLANHPLTERFIGLLPDFHLGYGVPIGTVIATRGGVIVNAVGVDIGCGIAFLRTNLTSEDLPPERLRQVRQAIQRRVPVGNVHRERPVRDLELENTVTPFVRSYADHGMSALGTLGGGNHFIELQADEQERVWIMIHSGSRNVGKLICDHYYGIAKTWCQKFHVQLPDMDLAFIPDNMTEYEQYLTAMTWAQLWAKHSRAIMMQDSLAAFSDYGVSFDVEEQYDAHHNFAQMEHHFGTNYLITRKGAVRAKGLVPIPGSMGTASYICEGLEATESFHTCSHGAGRVLSRRKANESITHEDAVAAMKHVVYDTREGDYSEHPHSYKMIDQVIANQADLVKPVYRLRPLMVVKG